MKKEQITTQSQPGQDDSIHVMSRCCWLLSVAALWPSCLLTPEEQVATEAILKTRLLAGDNYYRSYMEICQRILLTRQRMIEDPAFGISNMPCRFFNSTEKGFKLSEAWYQELLLERKKSPLYKLALRALAEAVLEFAEEPTMENFQYWKNWFITDQSLDEWMLYNVFASYILLTNTR